MKTYSRLTLAFLLLLLVAPQVGADGPNSKPEEQTQGVTDLGNNVSAYSFDWSPLHPPQMGSTYRMFRNAEGEVIATAKFHEKKDNRYYLENKKGEILPYRFSDFSQADKKWLLDERKIRAGKRFCHDMKLNITIDPANRKKALYRYGIPRTWSDTIPSKLSDLHLIQHKFQSRGVSFEFVPGEFKYNFRSLKSIFDDFRTFPTKPKNDVVYISPNWKVLIKDNKGYIKPLADKLIYIAAQNGYQTPRDIAAVVSSFVQSISYAVPDDHYQHPELGYVENLGLKLPLDTLCEDFGDCDSKALLFATIMSNVPRQSVIFLSGKKDFQHIFVGVNVEKLEGEKSIKHQGKSYLLIELTDDYPMGKLPGGSMKSYYESNPSKVLVVDNSSK